jgi:hypothetical protein
MTRGLTPSCGHSLKPMPASFRITSALNSSRNTTPRLLPPPLRCPRPLHLSSFPPQPISPAACPLLTLSSARPFSNGIFRSDGARLPAPRVLLPHTYTQDGWFLQPERRPARLPRRTIFSRCICKCSRMRARLPLHILLHTQVSR